MRGVLDAERDSGGVGGGVYLTVLRPRLTLLRTVHVTVGSQGRGEKDIPQSRVWEGALREELAVRVWVRREGVQERARE